MHDVGSFDRFAPLYEVVMPPAQGGKLRRGLALARRPVETGVDLAGGTGRASRSLDGVEWTVVDAARGMLATGAEAGVAGVQGDARRLPLRDGATDAVVVVDALHHVQGPRTALAEAARVLRPGGVLVVREFDPHTVRGRALVAAEHLVGFESTFLGPDALAAAMADTGLEPTVVERGFGYTVAGVKPLER